MNQVITHNSGDVGESSSSFLKYPWRYYIWDLGGTLLDNYESSASAFVESLHEFGLASGDDAQIHDAVYQALRVSTDQAIADFAPNAHGFLQRYRELEAPHLEEPFLFPGAIQVLDAVIASGGANYLVSHRDNQVLEILDSAGIAEKFSEVVTKNNGFARKPNPESFNYLINKYDLPRGETATVGDRPIDIEAGLAAGIATVYFDPPRKSEIATVSIGTLLDLVKS